MPKKLKSSERNSFITWMTKRKLVFESRHPFENENLMKKNCFFKLKFSSNFFGKLKKIFWHLFGLKIWQIFILFSTRRILIYPHKGLDENQRSYWWFIIRIIKIFDMRSLFSETKILLKCSENFVSWPLIGWRTSFLQTLIPWTYQNENFLFVSLEYMGLIITQNFQVQLKWIKTWSHQYNPILIMLNESKAFLLHKTWTCPMKNGFWWWKEIHYWEFQRGNPNISSYRYKIAEKKFFWSCQQVLSLGENFALIRAPFQKHNFIPSQYSFIKK